MRLTIEKLENIIKDELNEFDFSNFLKSTKHKLAQASAHSKTGLDFDQIGSGIAGNVAKHQLPDFGDEEQEEPEDVKMGQLDLPMDMPVSKDRKIPLDLQRLQNRYYELMTDTSVGRRSNAEAQELIKIQSILPKDLKAKIDKQIAAQKSKIKPQEPSQIGLFDAPPPKPPKPPDEEKDSGREKPAKAAAKKPRESPKKSSTKQSKTDNLTTLFDKVYRVWKKEPSNIFSSLNAKEKDVFLANNLKWTEYLAQKKQQENLQERWKRLAGIIKG